MRSTQRILRRLAAASYGAGVACRVRGRQGSKLALVLSAVIAIACAHGSPQEPKSSASPAKPESPSEEPSAASEARIESTDEEPEIAAHAPDSPSLLAPFFRALDDLTRGARKDHVRVLWLGDSHTAADFLPHRLRAALWERFGAGGAGFVHLGLKVYRHGAARVEQGGNWRLLPRAPSFFIGPQGDGVYGLGGMRSVPKDRKAWASVEPLKDSLRGNARWRILYRLPAASSRFEVRLTSGETVIIDAKSGAARPSGIHQMEFHTPANVGLRIDEGAFLPELFGVFLEGTEPGVVIDTLGINGARLATPLTWDEASFVAEVRERAPSLIVLAYGTNEIGDELAPWRYAEHLDKLEARMKLAAPEAACLLVGPTDRATPEWGSNVRAAEIDRVEREAAQRLGCEYFSTLDAMGGPGSLRSWAFSTPALAQKDRVHLTPRGYGVVGDALARKVLDDYASYRAVSETH